MKLFSQLKWNRRCTYALDVLGVMNEPLNTTKISEEMLLRIKYVGWATVKEIREAMKMRLVTLKPLPPGFCFNPPTVKGPKAVSWAIKAYKEGWTPPDSWSWPEGFKLPERIIR